MVGYDYSIHYRFFHDTSDAHAEEMARWLTSELLPYLPDDRDAKVLDVGCGFGFALRALRSLGFTDVMGLEQSAEQARVASDAGFRVVTRDSSAAWLSDHPDEWDVVLLLDVLEHVAVEKQITFLRAIHQALKAGGRVIITAPNANSILASRWRYIDYTHHSSFTEHSLLFVLRNAGFTTVNVANEKGIGRFPRRLWTRSGLGALRRWLVRWAWLQVYKAELAADELSAISFELNLQAVAFKDA
jgi:2-polyprenyl-3-methyl-5-hydroxy-6-metoxy-1,4-benzoquinol methylase